MPEPIALTIDGVQIAARPGQTIIQAAMEAGIYIPYLCYWPGMKPYGACRMCVVEIAGQRGTPASCTLPVANGMAVTTDSPQLQETRKGILELLLSEHPHGCLTCHRTELCGPQDICLRHVRVTDRCVVCPKNERCELKDTVRFIRMEMETPLSYNYRNLQVETRDPFYDRDYNLCIVCARCVRVCGEVRGDYAIAMVERSGVALVGASRGSSLLESGCEFCGACVDVCPVGALVEREHKWEKAQSAVHTTCPHCPVGCQVHLDVDACGRVIRSIGDWGAEANRGQLCFKGKFGMGFVNRRERLASPLVRRDGALVEATWEEALDTAAAGLAQYPGNGFGVLVSPRATNEEAYLAQKLARAVMGTNNVDLSAPGAAEELEPLARSLGYMAATGALQELENASCVMVVNANVTEEHNVAAVPIKKGHAAGMTLIVVDSREVELTRHADLWLRPFPGTEVALLGGILRHILDSGLHDSDSLASSQGLEALRQSLQPFDLGRVSETTGVPMAQIEEAARVFAQERPGAVLYALDNVPGDQRTPMVEALADLVLVTGNVGRPSAGLFPLRSGANRQGAMDAGCAPGLLPGHVPVTDPQARRRLQEAWGAPLPEEPGLSAQGMLEAARRGTLRAALVLGDGPALDEEALHSLARLEFLVVMDLFRGGLANIASVVLPMASFAEVSGTYTSLERRVQLLRPAVPPRGQARPALEAVAELASRLGAQRFSPAGPARVLEEMASLSPFYGGVSHARLEAGGIQWPCPTPDHPGTPHLPASGPAGAAATLLPLGGYPTPRPAGREFPLLHTPGRVLAFQGQGVEVVRGEGMNAIRREEAVELHPEDASAMGLSEGDTVELVTPAQRIRGRVRLTGALRGAVSTTSLFGELASSLDASGEPDPMLRAPGLDVLPARVEKAAGS